MKREKIVMFGLAGAFALVVLATGCETRTDTNTNTAVVTNTNLNSNANAVAAVNANDNRSVVNPDITREEYERDRGRYEREARDAGRIIGSGANDLWLWTKTRAALLAADDLRDSTVDVDVEKDVVTLSGTVGSQAQKTRAGEIAQRVEGVRNVRNNLAVSTGGAANVNATRNANTRN